MVDDKKTTFSPSVTTLSEKYSEAVSLYATTDMTSKQIASQCGVSLSAFRVYLRRHHRDLVLRRYGVEADSNELASIKLRGRRGQTPAAYHNYKEAIEACDNLSYIEFNISQIARQFNLDGTSLSNQLKLHYPEILERREKTRVRLGLADNFLKSTASKYAGAIESLRTTPRLLAQVASEYGFNPDTFRDYLHRHEPELAVSNAAKLRMKRKIQ